MGGHPSEMRGEMLPPSANASWMKSPGLSHMKPKKIPGRFAPLAFVISPLAFFLPEIWVNDLGVGAAFFLHEGCRFRRGFCSVMPPVPPLILGAKRFAFFVACLGRIEVLLKESCISNIFRGGLSPLAP